MAKIQTGGWLQSDIFKPKTEFGVSLRAIRGSIIGDWFLYFSADDGVNWQKGQDSAFSDTDFIGTFNLPDGFICKIMGGTVDATNAIEAFVGYTKNQLIVSIDNDITVNPDRTVSP